MARGAAEGLAIGSSFFHDSLATGERERHCTKVRQKETSRTLLGFVDKKKTTLSARRISNERNVDGVRCIGRCNQSLRTISLGTLGINAGAGHLDGQPLEYVCTLLACSVCPAGVRILRARLACASQSTSMINQQCSTDRG